MDPLPDKAHGWRGFEGLNLEKPAFKGSENPLQGRIDKLGLIEAQNPVLGIGKKISDYVKRSHNTALFPSWADAMPKFSDHKITASPSIALTCEAMEAKINDVITAVRTGLDYNGLHIVNDFIRFCERERKINPSIASLELFRRFKPDSKKEALAHGSTCVGKAQEIVRRLNERSIEAHVIVQIGDPVGHPDLHAAVAVPCKDGVLLVEVEHDIPIIPIKPNAPPWSKPFPDLTLSFEIIELPGNYKSPTPLIVKKEAFTRGPMINKIITAEYVLRPEIDPDQSVMKRWLVSERSWFYPVSTPTIKGQEKHSIQVNVAQDKVTFSIGNKKFRIPLSAFTQTDPNDPHTRTIDRSKLKGDPSLKLSSEALEKYKTEILGSGASGGAFFTPFKTDKNLLMDQIFNIAAHREMLKELREK